MRRLGCVLPLLALALVVAGAAARGAEPDDWRPERPDRLSRMDAELAPVLADFQPLWETVQGDLTIILEYPLVASPKDLVAAAQRRLDAAEKLATDLAAMRTLAASGLSILREWTPDPCWGEYHASQLTGWLLVGDSTQSVDAGDYDTANAQIGAAFYLLGDYGTLLHAVAVRECGG